MARLKKPEVRFDRSGREWHLVEKRKGFGTVVDVKTGERRAIFTEQWDTNYLKIRPVKSKPAKRKPAKRKPAFKPLKPKPPPKQRLTYIPVVGDEDELEEWAEQWGVSVDEAESILEYIEESSNLFDPPLDDYGHPDDDYMQELAEVLDIDVSDLYDLYYGYTPGES